jgi:hypothetical protein
MASQYAVCARLTSVLRWTWRATPRSRTRAHKRTKRAKASSTAASTACNGGHVCDPHKGDMGVPPASLAEFTLSAADGLDCYDVSLVEGYDLPGRPRSELPVSAQGSVQQQRLPRRLQERVPRRLKPDEQRGVLLGPV